MTPPTPDLRDQLQRSLGDAYRLERELGGGGMSRVFVAVETAFDRHVVVKVLLPELAAGVSVDRFRREIQLAAQLQHPHIVPLLAAGESGGLPYFTMPFVVGESLRARLLRDRELPVAEAIRLLRDVASALEYAHGRGIVHRDIKPDNVLLTHGVGVVTDFGVAKALTSAARGSGGYTTGLTSMGVTLGTPAYMAPEQASADPAMDHRVDVYAFGIMAYEMMTGQTPFGGRSPQAILGAHLAALPEPVTRHRPGMPPALAAVIMRCLEKHAADRPQTAGELIATLDTLTTPSGGTVPVQALAAPTRRASGAAAERTRRPVAPIVAGLVAAAALGVWIWSSRPGPTRPADSPGGTLGGAAAAAGSGPGHAPAERPESGGAGAAAGGPAHAPVAPTPPAASGDTSAGRPAPRPSPSAREPAAGTDAALVSRLRDDARSARRQAAARGVAPETLARGDSAVARAESLRTARRTTEAAAELSVAIAIWRNAAVAPTVAPEPAAPRPEPLADTVAPPVAAAPPAVPQPSEAPPAAPSAPVTPSPGPPAPVPPPDPSPRIRALYVAYAAALQTRSVPAIRQAYPGLTDDQARDWERFFGAVKDLKVTLHVTRLDVRGDAGDADLTGVYVFTDPGTHRLRQDSVSFHSTVRRDAHGWRIESLR